MMKPDVGTGGALMDMQVQNTLGEMVEQTRAALYGLLARLLYAAPDHGLLQAISLADDVSAQAPLAQHSSFAQAWRALQLGSQVADEEALADEFQQLFIGLGQGEVVPYMSWHLTGFLMEEPLARLRSDLASLGLARKDAVNEPEDHLAAVLEVMRFMIAGDETSPPATLAEQCRFFETHLKPWYALCLTQIEMAQSANYYRLVARMLRAFLNMEAQSFDMAG